MNTFFVAVVCLHVAAIAAAAIQYPTCQSGCNCEVIKTTKYGGCEHKWIQKCTFANGGGSSEIYKFFYDYSGPCPNDITTVNGQWGAWGAQSSCSVSCGGGWQTKERFCDSPAPSKFGLSCSGMSKMSLMCNKQACPSPASPSGGAPQGGACLASANKFRQRHVDTPDLATDPVLTQRAQQYADKLLRDNLARLKAGQGASIPHDDTNNRRYDMGENLYYGTSYQKGDLEDVFCPIANQKWYEEIKDWSLSKGMRKEVADGSKTCSRWTINVMGEKCAMIGHFTQMVWVASTKVGYGLASAPDPRPEYCNRHFCNRVVIVVAKYLPRGNFHIGGQKVQDYLKNVKPLKSGDEVTEEVEDEKEQVKAMKDEKEQFETMKDEEEQVEEKKKDGKAEKGSFEKDIMDEFMMEDF